MAKLFMDKSEEPVVTVKVEGVDELTALHVRREAVPLRSFCVELRNDAITSGGDTTRSVFAHRFRFDGETISFMSFSVRAPEERWVRFLVDRDGREDVVAAFREKDIAGVWQVTE